MSSSSSSSNDKTTGMKTSGFTSTRFSGVKSSFQRFSDEVQTQVMNEHGEAGIQYLFTDWPLIEGTVDDPDLDAQFTPLLVPPLLDRLTQTDEIDEDGLPRIDAVPGLTVKIAVTVAMKKDRRDERESIVKFNKTIRDIVTGCQTKNPVREDYVHLLK